MNAPRPRNRLFRSSSVALVLLAVGLLVLTGCPGSSEDPDGDNRRGSAKRVAVGQVVTDSIKAPVDEVDWKLIEIPGPGFLTVNVFWDDATVKSVVTLVDKYGVALQEEIRDSRSDNDQIIIQSNEATFYFVRITASKGESVYSMQSSFVAGEGGAGEANEPIPEFVRPIERGGEGDMVPGANPDGWKPSLPTGGGGGNGGGGFAAGGGGGGFAAGGGGGGFGGAGGGGGFGGAGGGGGFGGGGGGGFGGGGAAFGGGPAALPSGGGGGLSSPSARLTDLVPDFGGPYNAVEGQILRVIPRGQGGSEITIGLGSGQGISRNHVGELIMSDGQRLEGGRFVIVEAFKRSARAQTNAPANQVSAASRVVVKVPR